MTNEELQAYRDRFNDIQKCHPRIRDKRLISLMEDMEQCYNIPLLNDMKFNTANPEVIKLYREVSYARDL